MAAIYLLHSKVLVFQYNIEILVKHLVENLIKVKRKIDIFNAKSGGNKVFLKIKNLAGWW